MQEKTEEKKIQEISKYVSTVEVAEQIDLSSSGVSPEFVRKNYDSQSAREKFHAEQFGQKKTIVSADGVQVHRSHKAAKNKYGSKKASYHSAQADHKDPVKNIYERHKNNPWLTDEDIREVANRKNNFQELSGHENASKGDTSEFWRGIEKRDIKRTASGLKAQTETDILLAGKTAKAVASDFADGARASLNASAIPLAIVATQNIIAVANKEKTFSEAARDVGAMGASVALTGGTTQIAFRLFAKPAQDYELVHMERIGHISQIGNVVIVANLIAKTTARYIDGDISADGFLSDIGQESIGMVSGVLAHKLFTMCSLPGPTLVSMISCAVCTQLHSRAKELLQKWEADQEIQRIADAANAELKKQQEELRRLMEADHSRWEEEMNEIFQEIAMGLVQQDIQIINHNLRKLAKKEASLYESGEDVLNDLIGNKNGEKSLHLLSGNE